MNVIDLDSDLTEIFSLNLFAQAHRSITPGVGGRCFEALGYQLVYFPHFGNHNDVDFLLYNPTLKVAFLVELKGGGSVEEEHLLQINRYKRHSPMEIEGLLKNLEFEETEVKEIYTGIVYLSETINSCFQSESCKALLRSMMQGHIVMQQKRGDSLKAMNSAQVTWDNALKSSLKEGIALPEKPNRMVFFNDRPNYKVVVVGLLDYLGNNFDKYGSDDLLKAGSSRLRRDLIMYGISRSDLRKAIRFFLTKNYFQGSVEKFTAKPQTIVNLLNDRKNFVKDVKDYTVGQRQIDEFPREP